MKMFDSPSFFPILQKQRKVREQYLEDERRIERIMQLLPIAFLYQYEGMEEITIA